ncbi:hypothetical protein L195_g021179 [Trifolium pratense]|uniref:Uncharacterized protein n=1 Tax=Trifolium pratense TaxID=57577 RepID=A0A2K3N4M9_TRIPR|nr:hypothetical protein L195_g021179 [Trifolium pratense]
MEVEEKMEMGLCLVCDKPSTLCHELKHKRIRFKVIEIDDHAEVVNNTEKSKVEGIFPTDLNHVSTITSQVPTHQTSIRTPVPISPPVEHKEGHQMQLDNHILASITIPPKSPSLTDSAPSLLNPPMFADAEKARGQEKTIEDFILKINTKIDPSNKDSPVLSDHHNTHCVLPIWISPIIPPSEPPDRVAASLSSRNIHRAAIEESELTWAKTIDYHLINSCVFLPLSTIFNLAVSDIVTTTLSISTTPCPDRYSFTMLLTVLQLFDEMPKCLVAVWNALSSTLNFQDFIMEECDGSILIENGSQSVKLAF